MPENSINFLTTLSYETLELLIIAILAGTTAFFLGHYAIIRKDKLESIQASKNLFCEIHAIFVRVEQCAQQAILPTCVSYLNQRAEYVQCLIQNRSVANFRPLNRSLQSIPYNESNFISYISKVEYVGVKMQDVASKLFLVLGSINRLVEARGQLVEQMKMLAANNEQAEPLIKALYFGTQPPVGQASTEFLDIHVDLKERCNEALFYSYWLLYEISLQHNRKVKNSFVFSTKGRKVNEKEILSYGRSLQIDVSRFNGFETQFAKLMN